MQLGKYKKNSVLFSHVSFSFSCSILEICVRVWALAYVQENNINMFWYGKMKYICDINEAVVRQTPEYLKRKEIKGTCSETVRRSLIVLVLELSEYITES